MPSLFVLCLAIFAVGIALVLAARLLRSYPLVFFGILFVGAASGIAFYDGNVMLGIFWLVFSATLVVFAGMHLYKNIRGAFWWAFGSVVALVLAGIPYPKGSFELLPIILPVGAFFVIGLLGSLIVPRLMFRDKDQRKHLTNLDPLIGKRLKVIKDKEDGNAQRGLLGDIDWAIAPFYPYESFKVGDVVKVHQIKGVTLLCTRDGKDYMAEMKQKRKEDKARREEEAAKLREKKKLVAAQRKVDKEKEKARREEEETKRFIKKLKDKEAKYDQKEKERAEIKKAREDREAAIRARKEARAHTESELKKAREEAAKAKKEAEEARKDAEKARKEAAEALKKAESTKDEKPSKKEKKVKEKKVKVTKTTTVVKETKSEPVVKEKVHKDRPHHRFAVYYIVSSIVIILVCVAYVLLIKFGFIPRKLSMYHYIFFGVCLLYLISIFILEIIKAKAKKGTDKPEEKAEEKVEKKVVEEVTTVVEEVKVEEPVKEEEAEEVTPAEKAEFVPFPVRMLAADDFVKGAYNELKSELLSYGIKSRVSITGDTFRLHKKEYCKMVVAGKYLKLYLALNPADYVNTTYPFEDASKMEAHKHRPFVFKIKSGLSIRRAKVLIADAAKKDNLEQGEVVPFDHVSALK